MFCFISSLKVPTDLVVCRMHQGQKSIFTILFLLHKCKLIVIFLLQVMQKKALASSMDAYQLPRFTLICSNKDIKSRGKILCTVADIQSDQ